jgi:hypothetical protein
MSKSKIIVAASLFILSIIGGLFLYQNRGASYRSNAIEVDWRLLGELDYITGKANGELSALDGKNVRIPGFMVPLEDNSQAVTEFLLVPSPQACIHVPPPPPNQMVLVEMDPTPCPSDTDRADNSCQSLQHLSGTHSLHASTYREPTFDTT